jgi:hypothetical protein
MSWGFQIYAHPHECNPMACVTMNADGARLFEVVRMYVVVSVNTHTHTYTYIHVLYIYIYIYIYIYFKFVLL